MIEQQHRDRTDDLRPSLTIESEGAEPVSTPFTRSIESLVALALRAADADEGAFYEYSEFNGTLSLHKRVLRCSGQKSNGRIGAAKIQLPDETSAWLLSLREPEYIPSLAFREPKSCSFPEVIENNLEGLLIVPLIYGDTFLGVLNFGWRAATQLSESQRRAAEQIAASVGSVLLRSKQASFTIHLANRIYHLQAELADEKITDRVQGILLENSTPFDLGSVMRQHVDRVLDGTNGSELLAQQVAKLEAEVQSRRVIAGAKQILQKAFHLSEEEAYLRLRNTSRRSRRPIIEIAGEVVGASRSRAAAAHQ